MAKRPRAAKRGAELLRYRAGNVGERGGRRDGPVVVTVRDPSWASLEDDAAYGAQSTCATAAFCTIGRHHDPELARDRTHIPSGRGACRWEPADGGDVMAMATAGPVLATGSPSGASSARDAPLAHTRPRSSVKQVAWVARDDIDRGEWEAQGRWLGSIGRANQWWVGDWVRFGATKYGEKYAQAAELTSYDEHSLRNMAYVASRYAELSRRRDNLSLSHHAGAHPGHHRPPTDPGAPPGSRFGRWSSSTICMSPIGRCGAIQDPAADRAIRARAQGVVRTVPSPTMPTKECGYSAEHLPRARIYFS